MTNIQYDGDGTAIIGNHIRDLILESGEWLTLGVDCSCDNWTICQNHHDMAERLGIDPLDLVGILAVMQDEE